MIVRREFTVAQSFVIIGFNGVLGIVKGTVAVEFVLGSKAAILEFVRLCIVVVAQLFFAVIVTVPLPMPMVTPPPTALLSTV